MSKPVIPGEENTYKLKKLVTKLLIISLLGPGFESPQVHNYSSINNLMLNQMAIPLKHKKGFLVIKCTEWEAMRIGCGIPNVGIVCMHCNEAGEPNVYFVPALNDFMCPHCLKEWLNNPDTKWYKEDEKVEKRTFDRYCQLFDINPDVEIQEFEVFPTVIQKVSGCTADSLNVDGIEEIDMTDEQRQEVIDKIFHWLKKHPDQLNYLLQDITETFGAYESDDHVCECCGDYITTNTWVIG